MKFNRRHLVSIVLLVAGCGGGGYNGSGGSNDPPTSAPGATSTAFVPFIKTQLTRTSDTAEPVQINDLQFEFDESETAFDDVLQ